MDLEGFTKEEAAKALGFAGSEVKEKLSESIRTIVDRSIEDYLTKNPMINMDALKKAGTPHVLLRIKTLHTILDGFRWMLKEQYSPTLREIGERVGFGFSIDFIKYLKNNDKIPLNYDALLTFWSIFDSSADMGLITVNLEESTEKINVEIENSFLAKGYNEEIHRHCPFFEGYILGVIDGAMCQWIRWISDSFFKSPLNKWQAIDVKENRNYQNCTFTVTIMKEKYQKTRDSLVVSIEEFQKVKPNYEEANKMARIALECAVKEPIGLTDADAVSFTRLIKTYQKFEVPLSYPKWISLYDLLSGVLHGRISIDENTILENLTETKKLIDEWSRISLSDEKVKEIVEKKGDYGIFRK